MRITARNPLVAPECRRLKQHVIIWCGIALCCITDYSLDESTEDYLIRRNAGGFMHNPNMPIHTFNEAA